MADARVFRPDSEALRAFTPVEIPSQLWELEPKLLLDLFAAACSYGFPHCRGANVNRTVYLDVNKPLALTAVYPEHPMLYVGNLTNQPHFMFLPKGLVLWQRGLEVKSVAAALRRLDRRMAGRGLVYPQSGERLDLFESQEKYRVNEVFVETCTRYFLGRKWDAAALLARCDEPQLLATPLTASGRRIVCRAEAAPIILKYESTEPAFRLQVAENEVQLLRALTRQLDPRRYS